MTAARLARIDEELDDTEARLVAVRRRIDTLPAADLAREGSALAKAETALQRKLHDLSERRVAIMSGEDPEPKQPPAPPKPTPAAGLKIFDLDVDRIQKKASPDDATMQAALADYQQTVTNLRLTPDELKRPASLRWALFNEALLVARVRRSFEARDEAIDALTKRLEAMESAGFARFAGTWKADRQYERGSLIVDRSSTWIAIRDAEAGDRPPSSSWQLTAKSQRQHEGPKQ